MNTFGSRRWVQLVMLAGGVLLGGGGAANAATPAPATGAATQETPPLRSDDDTLVCNHAAVKGAVLAEVRCDDPVTEGRILLFARGSKTTIELPIQNDRAEAVAASFTLVEMDRDGNVLGKKDGAIALAAGTATKVAYTLDTGNRKFGVYSLVLKVTAEGKALTDREYYFGVTSDTKIAKAAEGDYLYGLDPNYGGVVARKPVLEQGPKGPRWVQGQCDLLGWIDAMGVDIVRCAGCGIDFNHQFHPERLAWITEALPVLKEHGLRVMGMAGPPFPNAKAPDGFLPEDMKKWTTLVEDTARKAPEIIYWELGNEPDLGYPSMDRYVQIYEETYKAIKRANPKAIVMNGAITFHGAVGPKNSRRLFELVKPEFIDVLAYHAHGPAAEHEQRVLDLTKAAALEFGKGDKPIADTESGMFVGSRKQEDMQAWMVVKKQTVAEAGGAKFLMTFRLHAFRSERGWGLLRSDVEPQPAIVAYRAMTEHLKGLAYQKKLELTQADAEGHGLAQKNGTRRACVLWANQPAFYNVYLKVAGSAKEAGNLRLLDVFGNASPADVSEDGVLRVEVSQSPIYVLWNAAEGAGPVAVVKSMLHVPDMATVVPEATSPLALTVENAATTDMTAVLSAKITAPGEAAITPEKQTITVPAGKSVPVELAVKWSRQQEGLVWPQAWAVFTDVAEKDVDLAQVREMPETIKGVAGRRVEAAKQVISLLRAGELPTEKRAGFVFGEVRSEREQVVRVGCTADFWMEVRLNGQVVCNTLKTGNGSATLTERVIELPLKAGVNLLACKVLSGKGGWNLSLASPAELPALLDPRKASNCIDLTLESGGKTLARERLALQPVRRIAALGDMKPQAGPEQWMAAAADAVLGGEHVTNLFEKQPDRSKWWQGEQDLSATAWIRCDEKHVYLVVNVTDDKDVTGPGIEKIRWCDCLRVGISKDGKAYDEYSVGRIAGKVAICRENSAQGRPKGAVEAGAEITAEVTRGEKSTFYAVALDRALAGEGVFRLNFLVNDNDAGYRKQYLEYSEGMAASNPASWQPFILSAGKRP